jgi:hypothetical protein
MLIPVLSAQQVVRQNASVPLESIIPATFKPLTEYLSRAYPPLTARDFCPSIVGRYLPSRRTVQTANHWSTVSALCTMSRCTMPSCWCAPVRAAAWRLPAWPVSISQTALRTSIPIFDEEADGGGIEFEIVKEHVMARLRFPLARSRGRCRSTGTDPNSVSDGGDVPASSSNNSSTSNSKATLFNVHSCVLLISN